MFSKKDDPVYARGLMQVLNEASLEHKGKETMALAKVMIWAQELEKRFLDDLESKPKKEPIIEPLKPVKKAKKAKKVSKKVG